MRLRKLAVTVGAILATGALIIAPSAQATGLHGPVNHKHTNTGAEFTTATVAGTLKAGTSVTMQTLFGNVTLGCSSGSLAGTAAGNNTSIDFSALNLACDSFIPGTTVAMSVVKCTPSFTATDSEVHLGLGATADGSASGGTKYAPVTGVASLSSGTTPCIRVSVSSGCTVHIVGSVNAWYDENKGGSLPNPTQELGISGSGLTLAGGAWAPSGCLGIVSAGNAITLNNVRFNTTTNIGAIDFVPAH